METTKTTRGAPLGNTNATKSKAWSDAIRKAMVKGKGYERLAKKLVDMAEEGDIAAMKEIGDRLEGKPKQTIDADVQMDLVVEIVKFSD